MTAWLVLNSVRREPRRLALGALGVAFPVAILAASLFFLSHAVQSMTDVTLRPLKLEQRALATSLNSDMTAIGRKLARLPGVRRVDRFAAADVVVRTPDGKAGASARLFAVDPSYLQHNPWVHATSGSLRQGALLGQSLRATPGFEKADRLLLDLAGSTQRLSLPLRTSGTVDLRDTLAAWFAVPIGAVQGDQALVPRALVIDYGTFERLVLPALKAQLGTATPVLNPGLTDLPPATLEAHISVDRSAYPPDPGAAARWSNTLRHKLERQAPGSIVIADDAFEPLSEASSDATNAKTLFILLAIPGILAAVALALAAQSALAEAHRREDALLRLRGATDGQLTRLAAAHAALAWFAGSAIGLLIAGGAVGLVTGAAPWHGVPTGSLIVSILLAVGAGALTTAAGLIQVLRASRRPESGERRQLERGWQPLWRRARLDVAAVALGLAILLIDVASGGLKQVPIEPAQGSTLALRFYVLIGLSLLWVGATLLAVRGLLAVSQRWTQPERTGALPSWPGAALRWLGRRPARTGVALVLGALAVAFGTQVVTFVATYRSAKHTETVAAFGSSLHLTPGDPTSQPPPLGRDITAVSPIRMVPARAGSDRKTIMAIDARSYRAAATATPHIDSGAGVAALARVTNGVLIAHEIAVDFAVGPGDPLPLTLVPDDKDQSRNIKLRVVGIFRSAPPNEPLHEMVMNARALPPYLLQTTDFYLARIAPGTSTAAVGDRLRRQLQGKFAIATSRNQIRTQRSLTALNLGPLGDIESVAAGLIAAIGLAVLGAFVVIERRREFAILEAVGADAAQICTGPAIEGGIAVLGAIAIGLPVGLGLGVLSVRILGLFFMLPPPLLTVPLGTLAGFLALLVVTSAAALGAALAAVTRIDAAATLREP